MSDDDLQQMYQEVILDAARAPHGREHFLEGATIQAARADITNGIDSDSGKDGDSESHQISGDASMLAEHEACLAAQSHQFNPTCGDEVTVHVEVSEQEPHRLERVVWDGQGCSISQASLSIMVDLVEHQTVETAMKLSDDFHVLMESRGAGIADESVEEKLGDAIVFQGVSRYPMRIKCALLGWAGLKASIAQALASMGGSEAQGTDSPALLRQPAFSQAKE
ncbi:Fe-S cluster assembly sulfur transfer protein SufU [Bifidobacterium aquikefiricola]|uniref:SUF system NifU family Fe-S cluster assembly protein n=1 Tax=Bifidobacterium aquikefiricola TaxID=3059038 RepID=A0AB39U962_9BIFI